MTRHGLSVMQRIVGDIELEPTKGCWLFTGFRTRQGYGRIKVNGRLERTHRLMYELHKGRSPQGCLFVTLATPRHA